MKTKRSKLNPNRKWQLWIADRGYRTIEHFDEVGKRTTVATIRSHRVYSEMQANGRRTIKLVWTLRNMPSQTTLGTFVSPEAAFDNFTDNL